MFSPQSDTCIPACQYFDIMSLFTAELEEPKFGTSGKGLKTFLVTFDLMLNETSNALPHHSYF